VRHNERNETLLCPLGRESEALAEITAGSTSFGTKLAPKGEQVHIELGS
jgi:hypothetical protein